MTFTKRFCLFSLLAGTGLILLLAIACDDPGWLQPPVVQRAIDISLYRGAWEPASFPVQMGDRFERAKILWHNAGEIEIPPVYRLHPSSSIPFRLIVRPGQDGTLYNESIVTSDSLGRKWNGLMTRLSDEIYWDQVDYLYVVGRTNGAILHIDLGRINEDRNGNGVNDTEDRDGNFGCSEDEDMGPDRLPDNLEPGYDASSNRDPSHDDWYHDGVGVCPVAVALCGNMQLWNDPADSLFYEFLNGTEGNRYDPASQGWPDDDLFGESDMKQVDDYYSYRIDFAADSFMVPGSDVNGWRVYRIPVKNALAAETTFAEPGIAPKWDNAGMMHMRVWVTSEGGGDVTIDTVLIARWYVE